MTQTHQENQDHADHLFAQGQWAAALAEYHRVAQAGAGAPASGPEEALALKTFEPGSVIIQEGDTGTSLFALVDGRVDVVRQGKEGPPRTVASMERGDVFGEHAPRSNAPRLASVVAATRTTVLELTREHVERIARLNPAVEQRLRSFHEERLLANLFRDNAHLSPLTAPQREALTKAARVQVVPAGQRVLTLGQANQSLYLLLRGQCRVSHGFPDGQEQQHPLMRDGDLFGELSVLLGLAVTATVDTATACTLLRLERADVEQFTSVNAELRESLVRLGSERLQRTAQLMSSHKARSAPQA